MQSIFSSAARQHSAGEREETWGRDGELKVDWTKPQHRVRPMGIEWFADWLLKANEEWRTYGRRV